MTKIISRKEAVFLGLKTYFNGKPCLRRGHICERMTKHKKCVECNREKMRVINKARSEKRAIARLKITTCKNGHPKQNRNKQGSCKDCVNATSRENYKKNREKRIARRMQWAKDNPEKQKSATAKYAKKNPEVLRAGEHRRRARKNAAAGAFSATEIKNLFMKQKGKCINCLCSISMKTLHRDHITPLSKGGSNYISNIQLLCARCNQTKSDKDPIYFARENGRLL